MTTVGFNMKTQPIVTDGSEIGTSAVFFGAPSISATEPKNYALEALRTALLLDAAEAATIYVAKDGSPTATGRSRQMAVDSIETAIVRARALNLTQGLIRVETGAWTTRGNLSPPAGWVLQCVHRTVTLSPEAGYENNNCFLASGGNFFEGFTWVGWQIDSFDNPTGGFGVAFAPGAFIDRLPYVHKCVQFRPQPAEIIGDPMDRRNGNPLVGNGGGVILADGSVPHPLSPYKQIMAWGATPSSPNGIGYCATNQGFINAVNAVSIWGHRHFMARSGGQVLLSGCSVQFGDYSLYADGYGQSLRPQVTAEALLVSSTSADAIFANRQAIIDSMWTSLVSNGYTTGWTARDEELTRRDAVYFLDAVEKCYRGGTQRPLFDFVRGLFKVQPHPTENWRAELVPVFADDKRAAFQASFVYMQLSIKSLIVGSSLRLMLDGLVDALNATLETPVFRKERSLVTAIQQQWTQPLSGVTRSSLPARFGGSGRSSKIRRSIVKKRGGRVVFSGQDDDGNAEFVGGMRISARTGQLSGRPFESSVESRAIEAAIALGQGFY